MAISSARSKYNLASMIQIFVSLALSNPAVAVRDVDNPTLSYDGVVPGDHIPHWDKAPSSLADYPQRDNCTVINPWMYTERLGLYKILLHATSTDPTLGRANNTANILWGLPLQHGWQFSSGRLQDFSNVAKCNHSEPSSTKTGDSSWNCISPFSWWASMNYYLAVLPFFGAVEAGVFVHWPHDIEMSASPHRPEDYCTSLKNCISRFSSLINNWADFFKTLKYRLDSPDLQRQKRIHVDSQSSPTPHPTLSPREHDIITKLWIAHTDSLKTAEPLFNTSLLPLMPESEQKFGLSWGNLISYIAAADFITDLNTTATFQTKYLPTRTLQQGDRPPRIPDFSWNVNMALYVLETALSVDQNTGDALKHAWQALMCSPASQARGRYMIANLLQPLVSFWNLAILLWMYITACISAV